MLHSRNTHQSIIDNSQDFLWNALSKSQPGMENKTTTPRQIKYLETTEDWMLKLVKDLED